VVTDLGTEFGVEVDKNDDTTSHVFQGMVVVQAGIRGFGDSVIGNSEIGDWGMIGDSDKRPATAVAGGDSDQSVTLSAGQSIRVGRVRETHQEPAAGESIDGTGLASGTLRFTHPRVSPQFVRRIIQQPKYLDLLDIVAGGDGTGNRRERGIDPTTGMEDPLFVPDYRETSRDYRTVDWSKFIDGIFVIGKESARLDSAGHVFSFPDANGLFYGSIWSRAAEISPIYRTAVESSQSARRWVYAMGAGEQFMPKRRGLLCSYSNAGITFDLEAIRTANPNLRPAKFQSVAGLADGRLAHGGSGTADLWIFVDGRLAFKRMRVQPDDGVFEVSVELGHRDGFLTIVVTNGGDDHSWDWFVFGDPVLEMSSTIAEGQGP